jgi:hypothetical protein
MAGEVVRGIARRALYTLSPSAWSRRELKLDLDHWQARMVDAPAGVRTIALTHRQLARRPRGGGCRPHNGLAAGGLDIARPGPDAQAVE